MHRRATIGILFAIGYAVWFATALVAVAGIVSQLPRHSQGEAVILPWPICVAVLFVVQLTPPLIFRLIRPIEHQNRLRDAAAIAVAFVLANATCLASFYKAWNRGW